jgi:hypothetical protein
MPYNNNYENYSQEELEALGREFLIYLNKLEFFRNEEMREVVEESEKRQAEEIRRMIKGES